MYCGSSYIINPSSDGDPITISPVLGVGNFGYNSICTYLVSFPSESKTGDQIVLKTTVIEGVFPYLNVGADYSEDAEQTYLQNDAIYFSDFPQKMMLVLIG